MITREERENLRREKVAKLLIKRYLNSVIDVNEVIQLLADYVTLDIEEGNLEEDSYIEKQNFALLFAIQVIKNYCQIEKIECFKWRILNESL